MASLCALAVDSGCDFPFLKEPMAEACSPYDVRIVFALLVDVEADVEADIEADGGMSGEGVVRRLVAWPWAHCARRRCGCNCHRDSLVDWEG
jgi:hypothetical protein